MSAKLTIEEVAQESNNVFEALLSWNERRAAQIARDFRAGKFSELRRKELQEDRLARARGARHDLVALTVERFLDCFTSRRRALGVPPGWRDIFGGFRATMRDVATFATDATMDPSDRDASQGSLALGEAFGTRHVACDLTPFGVFQAFLSDIYTNVAGVAGDASVMTSIHMQMHEVAWAASSYMLVHSSQGLGKSFRLARIKRMQVSGWVMPAGSGSACAGANGGLEYTCGRMLTYDEIPKEFYSADSDQIDKLKSSATDNLVSSQRSMKVSVGREGGAESWQTVHLTTHRIETHLMATNAGVAITKGKYEPDDSKV